LTNRPAVWFGIILVLVGLMFLAGSIFNFNAWVVCWPVGLIGVGLWLLLRPRMVTPGTNVDFHFLGEVRRRGAWQVKPEDLTLFIGDIDLDFTGAIVPAGETRLHISGFIGDVDIILPAGVAIKATSSAFVSDINYYGQKHEGFLTPVEFSSPDYSAAERKIFLEATWFVGDIKIRGV
jgi:predicted membrane protein